MNDKALFTIKLIFALAVLVGLLALGSARCEDMSVQSVQASGGLRVREAPGIESKAVYLLEDTETVIVLEERNGWSLVAKNLSKDMVLGWVCSDYLK